MTHAAQQASLYEQLLCLPERLTGEIIDGQLHTQPRPAWPHALAGARLNADIETAYGRGRGGPGGWWILYEPEIHFILDKEVLVPDIAGWHRERIPDPPSGHKIQVVPDWICEILSPSTRSKDREVKMPVYARHGVAYAWLVDPQAQSLEAFALHAGLWTEVGSFHGDDRVSVAPFDGISIALADLWGR